MRAGQLIQLPPFCALRAFRRGRPVQRALAEPAVETGQLPARQRGPDHAVHVDIDAARAEAACGRLVDFSQRGIGRVRTGIEPDDVARLVDAREAAVHRLAPDHIVDRTRHDPVERRHDALVLGRIERLTGFDIGIAPAIAVGVDNQRRPSLGLLFIACLQVHLRIEPAHHAGHRRAAASPQRVVLVVAEVKVVGAETGVDKTPVFARRVVDRQLPRRGIQGHDLRRRMASALLAEVRIAFGTDACGEPDLLRFVHDQVVYAGVAVPDLLHPPVSRIAVRQVQRGRRRRVAVRMLDGRGDIAHRVQRWHKVRAFLGRAPDQAIGIDGGIALVGGDRIMLVMGRRRPVPEGKDDIALDALRPARLGRRQFAGGETVGPVGKQGQRLFRPHAAQHHGHIGHGLSRLCARCPGRKGIAQLAERFRHLPYALGAQRMAGLAHVLDRIDPRGLGLHGWRHARVARRAGDEISLLRNAQQ